ncbi:MAG: DUF4338 domain-containing protein [Verrucomicrobia bacterium]|nr:DUF4338 domain-containing protein [Verrucomicrobiota bacterium]
MRLLKWTIRADACGIELESPPSPRRRKATPAEVRAAKDDIRRELAPALAAQFADPLVRSFIRDLEEPRRGSRRKNIRTLIADGAEVYARLQAALHAAPADRPAALAHAIQPYLQLVPGDTEPTVLDEFTGISLGDLWRYFRYTWSIPQTPIPGRQMFYLVRDRAHPAHAVIGIAALSNSPLVSPPRDKAVGWHPDMYAKRFRAAAAIENRDELRRLFEHLEKLVTAALDEINPQGLARSEELAAPTEGLIARLQRRAEEFASRREEALREVADAASAGVPLALQETELNDYAVPPVSTDLLELEGKPAPKDSPETLARRLLVAKKRAFELARLCRARLNLSTYGARLLDPATTADVLASDDFCVAMNTALTAAKSNRVGTNILEITTCGAVPPYNHLLGGKLVALLLLSPEVADDYRRRYGDRPAIISSQLKNAERTKDCTLAWLNTTSLYAVGSSQYERLRLPAGTITPEQPELRYSHIGDTEGYGTVQFSEETIEALQAALEERHQFRNVNSIFGEGFSPKFRKLRDGMLALGFNATVLMRHDQPRRMYGVPMWPDADAFLRGEPSVQPTYIRTPRRFRDATERIAQFWRRRWLASRLNYTPALHALRETGPWSLHEQIAHMPMKDRSMKSRPRRQPVSPELHNSGQRAVSAMSPPPAADSLQFWRQLAQAGPEACADELTPEQLARLHVPQALDDFLLQPVRRGFSLVLTGNAGDGKTHLLRRLAPELEKLGAEVETDATAAMRPNDVSTILRRWKKTHREGRPFCLAANEYPLYLLRQSGRGFAPVDEVERQCEHRLAYAEKPNADEDEQEKVLVVDLNLRNPLSSGFAGPLLDALLRQPDIQAAAKADAESDLAWNLRHLSHPTIRKRLLELFARLAAAGHRATVRELWVWAARLLFGSGQEDRKPVRSPERWFSSRLFEPDDRFSLSKLLGELADPAAHSHPRWDYRLEVGQVAEGWLVDGSPSLLRMDEANFRALKRRFYFEHQAGEDVLKLDGRPGAELLNILCASNPPEDAFKRLLIESLNLAYCPVLFPEMKTLLFLWIGHRFHEQPSHGHVANQSVSDYELKLLRPRLPSRLAGAFDYQPDHLLLECRRPGAGAMRLRVDHPLFVALERLRQGLPRQLLPDRELNRLDYFLEQLRRSGVPTTREFYIHNHDERTTAKVTLSADFNSYENVQTP